MILTELKSRKKTDVWLHRLNNDGNESKMNDAVSYFATKADAIAQHNNMVKLNPGKTISHNLHIVTDVGHFTLKLHGKYDPGTKK